MGKSIFKNTIYKFFLSVFNILIPFFIAPYINGLLDKQDFGVYNKALSMLTFFLVFATYGVYNYGIREISKVRDDEKKLSSLFTNLFMFGIITNLVVTIIYFFYVAFAVKKSEQLIFIVLIIQILCNTFMVEWVNEAVENYGFITKKTIIIRIISTVAIFLMVTNPSNTVLYALITSLTMVANNLVSFIHIKRQIKFDFSDFHLTKYLKPLTLLLFISNAGILYVQLDKILLGQFVSNVAVTEYNIPCNLINMVVLMMASLITVSLPRLNYYVAHNQISEYISLLEKSSRGYLMMLFPGCMGLFCLGYEVMYLYGTAKYIDSYVVLQLFALRFVFVSFYTIVSNQIMYVFKKEKQIVKMLFIGGIINLILKIGLIFFKILTPATAIITTTISEIILLLIMYRYVRKNLNLDINLFSTKFMKYWYISLFFIPIVTLIKQLKLGVLFTCLIAVPACAIFYFTTLLIMKDDMLFFFLKKIPIIKNITFIKNFTP